MFDLGWQELMLIAIVAVIVVGPRDLPKVVRSVSIWVRKARNIAGEFQASLEEVAREAELDDIRREANKIASGDLDKTIGEWVDPEGDTSREVERIAREAKAIANAEAPVDTVVSTPAEDSPSQGLPAPAENPSPDTQNTRQGS